MRGRLGGHFPAPPQTADEVQACSRALRVSSPTLPRGARGPALYRPWASTQPQLAPQARDADVDFGGNMGHRPILSQDHGHRHGRMGQHEQGHHRDLGWQRRSLASGCSSPPSCLQLCLSSKCTTVPHRFLSHLSVTFLPVTAALAVSVPCGSRQEPLQGLISARAMW